MVQLSVGGVRRLGCVCGGGDEESRHRGLIGEVEAAADEMMENMGGRVERGTVLFQSATCSGTINTQQQVAFEGPLHTPAPPAAASKHPSPLVPVSLAFSGHTLDLEDGPAAVEDETLKESLREIISNRWGGGQSAPSV